MIKMITLFILLVIAIVVIGLTLISLVVGGASAIIIFADVLIGVAFIYFIIRRLIEK